MIQFNDWVISDDCSTPIIARQYDNLSCSLTVVGDLPAGWDWSMLVESGGNLNIISLSPVDGGVGVTLTADMIPYAGYYRMQLRGTQGEAVRHTNIIQVYIPESLTGEGQWPDLPSEFGQIEERMQELAGQAQDSADAADTSAKAAAESAAAAQGAEESVAANAKAAQDAANAAQTSEGNAKTSETNAAKSAGDAQTSAGQAADSATQAKTAQGKAEAAQTAAETAQGKAETAAGTATQAAQGAVTSAGQASQSAQEAASAATAAQNAQKAAENAQGQAEAQATAAAWSATAAQESAVAAAGSSSSASGSAQTAQTAAQNAQKSAETAQEAQQGAQAAQQAIEDLEVSSETLEPDSPASVEKTVSPEGVVTLEFGIPRGPQGQPGANAPQINDAIITDANPWSAKKIVDTLAPEFETSGAVVTCTPVAGYPLHVVSQIMPVQGGEGDPSPDNVRPISGWDEADLWVGGANLFNPDNLSGGQLTELDGVPVYQFRDGATGNFMFPVPNIKNQQFTLRLKLAGTATKDFNFALHYSDGSYDLKNIGNGLGPYTITSSAGKTLTSIRSVHGWGVIRYIDLSQTMLVVGLSVPADFSPYRGQTITLPFGQTVYGGTLDWTTGVMTVDWVKYVATGQENVLLGQTFQANHRWYFEPPLPTLGDLNQRSIQCNVLKTAASGNTDEMGCVCTGINLISVLLPKDTVPDEDSAKKWLQDNQPEFVYKTSQVKNVQLTPTEILALSGTNTIYTDTGDTTVSGRADPNTIIQQLAQRIAALEGQAING